MSDLNNTLPITWAPVNEVIEKIALAFDYDAVQTNAHSFLLNKRYSDENDLPCVTYAEVVHALRQMLDIIETYAPDHSPFDVPYPEQFYRSLTDSQKSHASQGLGMSDLTADQQSLAVAAAGAMCIGNDQVQLRQVYHHLVQLKDPKTAFTWITIKDVPVFGYRGQTGPTKNIADHPLDHNYQISAVAYGHVEAKKLGQGNDSGGQSEPVPDLDEPTDIDKRLAAGMLADRLPSTLTLADAAKAIVDRTDNRAPGLGAAGRKIGVEVDEAVAPKPVCLYGAADSSADQLIRSLTTIYGLELFVPKVGHYTIVAPIGRLPKAPDEFGSQLLRLVPRPLTRQYEGLSTSFARALPKYELTPAELQLTAAQQKQLLWMHETQDHFAGSTAALEAGYYPAVRRLLVLARPSVPTPASPPVTVASLGPEVLRLISVMLYSTHFRLSIRELNRPLPVCLADTSRLVVKVWVGSDVHGSTIKYQVGYKDDAGQYRPERTELTRPRSAL